MTRQILGILAVSVAAFAQNDTKPLTFDGFENQGSATFGYRFTDVNGYRPKFEELFDLNSGPRLLDFSLFGKAKEEEDRFANDYSLNLFGVGGDPYSTVQATVRKNNRYDLRVDFRQSHYYWNRNDSAILPNGLDGLTNNHNWATVRKLGSINLLIHATNNLRFSFEYYRNTRDGVTFTTRSLDYFGSSATWGSFARANPYYMIAPLSEAANRITAGVDYTHRAWTLHYKLGYQRFKDSINGQNAATGERSINIDDPTTAPELLNGASWSDSRNLSTPVSEFSYTGRLSANLEARGGYIFYRYRGPAALDISMDGIARANSGGTADAPYSVALSTRANVTEPNQVVDQGLTYKVKEWWQVLLDYRYSRFTVDSAAQFRSVNADIVTSGTADDQWRISTNTLDLNLAFTPSASLLVRAGVRLQNNDVLALVDGVVDATRTKTIHTAWPIGSIYFQPSKVISIRANVEEINNGTSYTRVTPHTDIGARFIVRVRPTEKFYLEDTAIVRNRKLLETDYRSTIRSNAATINYEFSPRFTAFAGFSYDSFFAADFVNFLRGPAPITNVALRDQTVDRVWQAGLRVLPVKRLGIDFTGNYVRSTGLGEISGEAPLYGPMKFPYVTGSLYYDFPAFGRFTVQLQRTYYVEEIVPGNNFGAKLLMIAWTRSF
ncbi:MAG: TonB-dependent receptor [Bryobacterales bacterium]|nr:TonB-dependent receptor [Bryobacterales bacterium]MBV9399435.1 TonB-dependent receptor [Bryobacterales bacterium]